MLVKYMPLHINKGRMCWNPIFLTLALYMHLLLLTVRLLVIEPNSLFKLLGQSKIQWLIRTFQHLPFDQDFIFSCNLYDQVTLCPLLIHKHVILTNYPNIFPSVLEKLLRVYNNLDMPLTKLSVAPQSMFCKCLVKVSNNNPFVIGSPTIL